MQIKTLLTTILTIAVLGAHSQVVINEFQPGTDQVEIKNTGDTEISVANFFLCSFPVYNELNELTIESGDLMLSPGEIVVLSGHAMGDMDDELGLYIMPSYANPDAIIDYVEWGSTGHQRSSVAQAAGIWGMGDFIPTVNPGESIQWDGLGDSSSNWFQGPDTFGADNGGCEVEGGDISTMDPTEICAGDGVADPINVTLEGNAGANSAWVITDESGTILGLPPGSPFDLEGAGEGVCLIWHLSFEDGLVGAELGLNANDLEGCFDLSNPISVTRNGVAGGTITTEDPTTICADDEIDDTINVTLEGNEGQNSAWVITEEDGTILGLPPGPPFNLEGAGPGVCLIWHLSFEDGLVGAAEGLNANDLEGCFSLSNPISVNRLTGEDCDCTANGGTISTMDPTEICAGDGVADAINVDLTGASGTNSAWVITDENGTILGLPPGSPFDLEGAGEGVCLIWHLSFEDGLIGAEEGLNANDLEGCFDLSNPITVTRNGVAGGMLSTSNDENTFEICAGDGIADPIDVTLEGNEGQNSAWVITDDEGNILGLPPGPPFDLEEAGEGTCLIWNISFEDGLLGAEVGENTADLEGCYALSNPVTVVRNGIAGGTVSTDDGETLVTVTVGDGNADEFTFASADNQGENFAFIITEEDGTILDILDGNTADFEGAPAGICHVYGFSYYGDIVGDAGDNVDDLASTEGCSQISENFVIIDRQPVGVDENLIENLEIWPNPASQTLNIQLPATLRVGQLSIYNAQGQNVWTDSINGSGNLQVDVSHLAKGAYHLHLTNGVDSFRSTLLKQ